MSADARINFITDKMNILLVFNIPVADQIVPHKHTLISRKFAVFKGSKGIFVPSVKCLQVLKKSWVKAAEKLSQFDFISKFDISSSNPAAGGFKVMSQANITAINQSKCVYHLTKQNNPITAQIKQGSLNIRV